MKLAWSSVIEAAAKMMPLFLLAATLYVMFGVAVRWIFHSFGPDLDGLPNVVRLLAVEVLVLPAIVFDAVLLAPVAVAVHRFVLLEEVSPGLSVLRQPCLRNFAIWTFCVQVALDMVDIFSTVAANTVIHILAIATLVVVFARTLLIFPAVAIDVPAAHGADRIEASLSSSRGLFWATLIAVIVAALPLAVVALVPGMVAVAIPTVPFDEPLVSGIVGDFARPFVAAVFAALASWIYMWTQEYPYIAGPSHASKH